MPKHTLTGNDLALAEQAIMLALGWYRKTPSSGYKRQEMAKLNALLAKMTAISDHAYPYDHYTEMGEGVGREIVMQLDRDSARQTRADARRAKRAFHL